MDHARDFRRDLADLVRRMDEQNVPGPAEVWMPASEDDLRAAAGRRPFTAVRVGFNLPVSMEFLPGCGLPVTVFG